MNQSKTIYIFGNPLLSFDNLPIKLLPKLKRIFPEINFIVLDPNENLKFDSKEIFIIDSVLDIENVKIINDIEKIQVDSIYSMHDFDLAFNLKLLKKIGKLERVTIFGVPMNLDENVVLEQLVAHIQSFF